MRFGINLLLWTDDPTPDSWLPLYERLAAMGYDGVELPLWAAAPEAFEKLGPRLDDLGLARTGTMILTGDADPISPDDAVRDNALARLRHGIDCARAVGIEMIGGPQYAALGVFPETGPTREHWERALEVVGRAAREAEVVGIAIGLEVLNRFEIQLLNTAADGARFVADLGCANVGVHYDTFHAHIEEKDPGAAIRGAGAAIHHVHVSENDRSTPGTGQVRWRESFDALAAIGYDGWLTVEAFGHAIPSLAAATKIWRRMFESEEQLARDALAFMQSEWRRATAAD